MIAVGDPRNDEAILSEILRRIASAQEISGKAPNIEKTRAFVIPILKLGSRSLCAANRLQTVNIVKTLSGKWLLGLQEITEKMISDKRKSVRNAAFGLKPQRKCNVSVNCAKKRKHGQLPMLSLYNGTYRV